MSDSRQCRDRRHYNLLLSPDLHVFVQCIAVNARVLFTSWNGFLRLAGTRHTWQARYSLQVHALLMKLKTLYSECFLSECVQCDSVTERQKISAVIWRRFQFYTPPTEFLTHHFQAPSKYSDDVPYNTRASMRLLLNSVAVILISNINMHVYVITPFSNNRKNVPRLTRQMV
jgi:hypothetical protein